MTASPPGAAVFAPIGETTLVDRVRNRLEDAIALGILAPGEQLPSESVLAARFRVSMVTVREALGQLRATGFVITRRGRGGGSFVDLDPERAAGLLLGRLRAMSRAEISDLGTYYRAIGDSVMRAIVEQGQESTVEPLRENYERQMRACAAGGSARIVEGSLDMKLAGASQSVRLVHEQIRIQNDFGPLLWMCLDDEATRARLLDINLDMLDKLAGGHARAAVSARGRAVGIAVTWLLDRRREGLR